MSEPILLHLDAFGFSATAYDAVLEEWWDVLPLVVRDEPGPGSLSPDGGLSYRVAPSELVREECPDWYVFGAQMIPALLRWHFGPLQIVTGPRGANVNLLEPGQDMEWHVDSPDLVCTVSVALYPDCEITLASWDEDEVKPWRMKLDEGTAVAIPKRMPHSVPAHRGRRATLVFAYHEGVPSTVDLQRAHDYQYGADA